MGMTTGWFENYPHSSSRKHNSKNGDKGLYQSKLTSFSHYLWKSLVELFTSSSEPHVWQKHDRQGNLFWQIYDPSTNQSATFASENEVRIWLEERYYH